MSSESESLSELKSKSKSKPKSSKTRKVSNSSTRSKKSKLSYWLVFTADTGNNEDCSVYYSDLVKASSKGNAIQIIMDREGISENINEDCESDESPQPLYEAKKMRVIKEKAK